MKRILIACEFSGRVRDAFSNLGYDAVSCDFIPSETPGKHYMGDVRDLIKPDRWDLMIAFPPCTYLARSGGHLFKFRKKEQEDALEFIRFLMDAPIKEIAIENPIGVISTYIRKPDQILQPWMFGHGETKATCLWLKNLPKLRPSNIVSGRTPRIHSLPDSIGRSKKRSITYRGIADAMALQWGNPNAFLLSMLSKEWDE